MERPIAQTNAKCANCECQSTTATHIVAVEKTKCTSLAFSQSCTWSRFEAFHKFITGGWSKISPSPNVHVIWPQRVFKMDLQPVALPSVSSESRCSKAQVKMTTSQSSYLRANPGIVPMQLNLGGRSSCNFSYPEHPRTASTPLWC